MGIDIDLPEDLPSFVPDQDDELGSGFEAASQIVRMPLDIRYVLIRVFSDRRPADATAHRNAGMFGGRPDIRAELQEFSLQEVDAHPIELRGKAGDIADSGSQGSRGLIPNG